MLFLETEKKPLCTETPEITAHCNCICSLLKFFLHRIFCSRVLVPLEFPELFSATIFFFSLAFLTQLKTAPPSPGDVTAFSGYCLELQLF